MFKLFLVGIGGFVGSISRYLAGGLVHKLLDQPYFPFGTLTVNVLGCLLIGFLNGIADTRQLFSPEVRMLIFVGFLGGFTTFSTFGYESFGFLRDGQLGYTAANIVLNVVLGLIAVLIGHYLSRFF